MSGGWFVFSVVACIVFCTGCLLAVAMLKASWAQKERETLTSSDLRALEESALYLIDQLKSESEQAIGDLESRRLALAEMMEKAEKQAASLKELLASTERISEERSYSLVPDQPTNPKRNEVLAMASAGVDCSEIARKAGMDCAEVKLMLRMAGVNQKTGIGC